MRTQAEIQAAFAPVAKLDPSQTQRLMNLQVAFTDLALLIEAQVPESADRTSALRKLLEAKFTCTQAVTHCKAVAAPVPSNLAPATPAPSTKEKAANANEKKAK